MGFNSAFKGINKNCGENQNTILYSIIISFENSDLYEIMWRSVVEPERSQMTIWRMRITCWITKATYTHSECVIIIAFYTATMLARTRLNVTFVRILAVLFVFY